MVWTFSWNSPFVIVTASDLKLCGHVAAEIPAQERALKVNLVLRGTKNQLLISVQVPGSALSF